MKAANGRRWAGFGPSRFLSGFRSGFPFGSLSGLLPILLSTALVPTAHAGDCRWQERLDFSLIHDSNVFETVSATRNDLAGRLHATFAGSCHPSTGLYIALDYNGGLEIYSRYSEESRLVNSLRARLDGRLGSRFTAGVTCHGREKLYFQATRGFSVYRALPHLTLAASDRFRTRLFGIFSWLDHDQGVYFDFQQIGIGLALEQTFSEQLLGKLQFTLGESEFNRAAVAYEPLLPEEYPWLTLAEKQTDNRREAMAALEFYGWALLQCDVSYATNRSNAYGYAYNLWKTRVLLVKTLPWDLTLRLYWTALYKEYTEDLEPLLQVRPDTENEENSHTLVDLSRDLGRAYSLRIRLGWYRNES
ncbi:MAG: hypothetical protein ABIF77_20865, partial [bacterium]